MFGLEKQVGTGCRLHLALEALEKNWKAKVPVFTSERKKMSLVLLKPRIIASLAWISKVLSKKKLLDLSAGSYDIWFGWYKIHWDIEMWKLKLWIMFLTSYIKLTVELS